MMPSSFTSRPGACVKSRQDRFKVLQNTQETNGMNFNNFFFFERATALKTSTTMEDDSFRQESPVNTSKAPRLFLNLILISLVVCKSFMDCFDQQCLEYQKKNNGKSKI
ncbi:hypothetical protein TNCV_2461301 [Trichonephila clavipes]|nr:hypothetical protein TNCV_2461301 [Trichonephila clavipes]